MPRINSSVQLSTLGIVLLLAAVLLLRIHASNACKISEFSCRGSAVCLPLDKYCDGRDDCGDASDEPKYCTVCNRTYYGDIGRTYSLRVPPPQWTRLPFLCHLTFTASGHEQGDLVQIIFDGFSVGRFDEGLSDNDGDTIDQPYTPSGELHGCPEGFMQLSELGRPFTGGSWCGKASGHQLYYSETSTVTASVKVFHPPMHDNNAFEFRIRYKFISQSDAVVRYGSSSELLELGRVTPGTYCTRQFDECYRKKCRLQSPNYPGMYPRNVTCYWTIRQKTVPTCKHAMIGVSQESEHKSLVKRSIASLNKTSRSVRAWSDCTGERDHLIFYDGSSTNDPVLAKYCGGDWLPKVVARGSEMLIAFHSSPFSAPLQTGIANRGFELDVDVSFADSDSHDFAKDATICEFHVNASNPDEVIMSRRGRMGRILSPRHTLPPNTTCTYYFHGQPTDRVWIYFTNYHLQILQPVTSDSVTSSSSSSSGGGGSSGSGNVFNNTHFHYYANQNELLMQQLPLPPPWITRMRIWDSVRTNSTLQNASNSFGGGPPGGANYYYNSVDGIAAAPIDDGDNAATSSSGETRPQYYEYTKPGSSRPSSQQQNKVNIDAAWNPIDTYIYGPTRSTIFNQQPQFGTGSGGAGQLSNNNQQLPSSLLAGGASTVNKGANSNNYGPANRKSAPSSSSYDSAPANWGDDHQYYQPTSSNVQQQKTKSSSGNIINPYSLPGSSSSSSGGGDTYPGPKYTHNQYSGTNIIDAKHNTYPGGLAGGVVEGGAQGSHGAAAAAASIFDESTYDHDLGFDEDEDNHYGHVDSDNEGHNNGANPLDGGGGSYNPYGNINRGGGGGYAKQANLNQNNNNNNAMNNNNNNINRNNNRNFNNNQQQQLGEGFNRYQTVSTSKSSTSSVPMPNTNNYNSNNNNNNRNNQRGFGYSPNNPSSGGGGSNNKKYSGLDQGGQQYNNANNYQTSRQKGTYRGTGSGSGGRRGGNGNVAGSGRSGHNRNYIPSPVDPNRKLLLEIYDNESPKLCDHSALEDATSRKTRPCSPLESYVSTGNDMKIEFQTQAGTALHPSQFTLHYEFVDTAMGGDKWSGKKGDDPVPSLCSRVFRSRRGEVQSPRNVFLHGRGGAKNLTCLYRFEAGFGERVRLSLHNVSFGEAATCATEADLHTGRAKCSPSETADPNGRFGELRIFDVPTRDVKIPLGCFCDNTSSLYNTPITFVSNSRTLEVMFTVTKLNISEDFADIYFHASYEMLPVPDCRKQFRLRGAGGEEEIQYPLGIQETSCDGQSWLIEAQQSDRSLFVLTWGSLMSFEPSQEEVARCNTRNRLIIYAGRPLKIMRVVCPAQPHSRSNTLHIFSEDWLNAGLPQQSLNNNKPMIMVLEPVMREPGVIGFSWLEIQRTKSSLIQQLDLQTNLTANDTLGDYGFFPRQAECEHKCPELDACIGSNLWCDGRVNCPSGYDESEVECGAARRLLELSSGLYAALGCVAAACAACLIFCFFGILKKRKKALPPPTGGNNYHTANSLYGSSAYFSSTNHSNASSNYNSINRTTLSKSHGSRSTLNGGTLKKKESKKMNGANSNGGAPNNNTSTLGRNNNNNNNNHHQNGDLYIDPDS